MAEWRVLGPTRFVVVGGTGSGKSTASAFAATHGVAHIELDGLCGDQVGRTSSPPSLQSSPEVIVLITSEGDEMIIHAMPLRAAYRKLLDP